MNAELCELPDPDLLIAWHDLWQRAGASPFAGPQWHLARHETYGGRGVGYLVARDAGQLCGVWPVRPGAVVRPAGALLADYLSPLLAPGRENDALQAFAEWFARGGRPVVDLPRQEGSCHLLVEAMSRHGYRVMRLPGEAYRRLDLAGGPEAVEAGLSSDLRRRCRYAERRLGREAPLAVDFVPREDVPRAMAQLMAWHSARFRRRGTPGSFFGRRRVFHVTVAMHHAEAGLLRLVRLRSGDRTVALLYALRGGESYSYYAAGFDPDMARFSPGLILLWNAIRLAAKEGVGTFDFLRGDEAYKEPWTSERQRLERIVAAPRGRHGYLSWAALENSVEMSVRSHLV